MIKSEQTIPGGYCRDCKWWQRDMSFPDRGTCQLASEAKTPKFFIGDPGDVLRTSGDFGCVLWEPQQAGEKP